VKKEESYLASVIIREWTELFGSLEYRIYFMKEWENGLLHLLEQD
jgi:hypothetical protein